MAGIIDYGLVNPNLTNAFSGGYNQAEQNRNALLQQQQARQMAELQLRGANREEQNALAESEAYKQAGGDYNKLQQNLMAGGLGKQSLAVGAQIQKMDADRLSKLKTQTELMGHTATHIMANPTLENALNSTQLFGKQTGADVSADVAQLQQIGNNPEALRQWAAGHALKAENLLPKFEQVAMPGGGKQLGTVNPVTGKMDVNQTIAPEMTPYEKQRLSQENRRINLSENEATLKREGIEGISPKEMQKREATLPQATSTIKGFENKSDTFIKDLKALRNHPGLSQITGLVAGRVPAITSEGRAAQALYDKVVAKGGFQALQDLRDASKTGGALGNVSNQEGKQLTASFAAISRIQDAKDVQAAIDDAIGNIEGAKTRMREAYDATYSYKNKQSEAGKPATSAAPTSIDALLNKYK